LAINTTFVVGRDCSAVLISPYGTQITLALGTTIEAKPEYQNVKSVPLNSPPIERALPNGHRLTFSYDRVDSSIDRLFSQIEANWWAEGTPDGGTNSAGSVFIFINEAVGGGTTTIQYNGVTFMQSNSGSFSLDKAVTGTIEAFAQTRTVT
jgi:hypothetical protein